MSAGFYEAGMLSAAAIDSGPADTRSPVLSLDRDRPITRCSIARAGANQMTECSQRSL
jgi:hypothetical protein